MDDLMKELMVDDEQNVVGLTHDQVFRVSESPCN